MSKSLFEYKDFRLNLSIAELFSLRWPLHRHYALEMLFVKSGYMKLVYDDGAQQKILHVSAGEFIVFFPNVAHAYLEQAMGSRFYVLNINPHAVPAFHHYFLLYQPVRPLLSVSALPADFSFIFERFSSPEILQESEGICHAYLSIFFGAHC